MPELRIQLFGDFQIHYKRVAITVKTQRLQDLIIYLVLHRNIPQTRSHLAYLLWPESTNTQARTNLRNAIFLLHKQLPFLHSFLFNNKYHIYWCESSEAQIDVADFETLVDLADQMEKAGELERSIEFLGEAAALYKGDLAPACFTDWIVSSRDHFRQTYILILERLISHKENQNEFEEAIKLARMLINLDPLYESGYQILMRLLAFKGNRAEALRIYHRCSEILQRELQVEPSSTTQQLYEWLLKRDLVQNKRSETLSNAPLPIPLVGRQIEWNQLLSVWDKKIMGNAHFILISGESGIGKTRLCEEFLQWAGHTGVQTATVQCYSADSHLAYAPITAWLRSKPLPDLDTIWLTEITRLLPEIWDSKPGLERPLVISDEWQRQLFHEALVRALLIGQQPFLLFIDNLQWIDEDSLDWFYYVLRFNWNKPLLIIGALRTEDIIGHDHTAFFLNAIRKNDQLTKIELLELTEEQTLMLANHLSGKEFSKSSASRLFKETDGNPLFIVEMIRTGWTFNRTDSMNESVLQVPTDLPSVIQANIEDRLENLSSSVQDILGLASIIGHSFSLSVLEKASGMPEDVFVRALDELSKRHIIREIDSETYQFIHMKLRDVVYSNLSSVKKHTLRRRITNAINLRYLSSENTG